MAFNNYAEVTNSDNIAVTDRTSTGPAPDGSTPAGSSDWGSITGTPTSAAGYGIVNGSELDAFAALGATGLVTRTGANAYASRSLTAGDNVSITNGSGVAGNPTIAVPSMPWADVTGTPTTLAGYGITDAQPLDSDLTTIAGLSPANNDVIQRKSGAWTNRTLAQYWSDLMADPTVSATAYTGLPFSITNDKRLIGRDAALPPFVAQEIAIGTSLDLASATLNTIQDIRTTATPQFTRMGLGGAAHASARLRAIGPAGAVPSPPTYSTASGFIVENNDSVNVSITSSDIGYPEIRFYRSGDASPRVSMYADLPTDAYFVDVLGTTGLKVTATGINGTGLGLTTPALAMVTGLAVGAGLVIPSEEIQLGNNRAVRFSNASASTPSYAQMYVDGSDNYQFYLGGANRASITTTGINSTAIGATTPSTVACTALTTGSTTLLTTSVALTDGAAAAAGTLLNAPAAGNPTKWIPINDNGTTRYIPAW